MSFGSLEMYIQVRDKLSHDLSIQELNNYFSRDILIKNEMKFELLTELNKDVKISHKSYIEKTINAPNILLAHAI